MHNTDDSIDEFLRQHQQKRRHKLPLGFLIKALLALLLPLLVVLMVLPGPDGKPVMSLSDWMPEKPDTGWLSKTPLSRETSLYRWQDEQGHWNFSQEKPTNTALYETMTVSGNVNTLPANAGDNAGKDKSSTVFSPLSDQVKNSATVTNQYTKGTEKP